jgi:hypothetical protein
MCTGNRRPAQETDRRADEHQSRNKTFLPNYHNPYSWFVTLKDHQKSGGPPTLPYAGRPPEGDTDIRALWPIRMPLEEFQSVVQT